MCAPGETQMQVGVEEIVEFLVKVVVDVKVEIKVLTEVA